MLYRPWRNIVDAAVAKELRLTFLNLGDDSELKSGILGVQTVGTPKPFRLEELIEADEAQQFILEKSSGKTRMVDPSHRSILTFSRASLLDPSSHRHVLVDEAIAVNSQLSGAGAKHMSAATGEIVYHRDLIRMLQVGRQNQKISNKL